MRKRDRQELVEIARRVLVEHGFKPDPPDAHDVRDKPPADKSLADLRDLPWSSIDNEESRDLDQVEVADAVPGKGVRLRIGIADVDAFVPKGSALDAFAYANTTSLYTGVKVFPMLPVSLSYDRTSLLEGGERRAMVTEMVVREDGTLDDAATKVYPARVTNHAKLVYEHVGAWLEDGPGGQRPSDPIVAEQVELQDAAAQRLRARRKELGALDLETLEPKPIMRDGEIINLELLRKNRARELIEDFMIAANGATARFLEARGRSTIRRVVRRPERWDRIVELASELGSDLPPQPDASALADFLAARRKADPLRFPEVSLAVVKLLGPGEYVLQPAGAPDIGHFGLAVEDYMHSTAPNRRYPDLVTQRLLRAAANDAPPPYTDDELAQIAMHCTERENAARKVERTMRKVAAASLLQKKIGQEFDAIVTGAAPKGTYVRLLRPPAEGRVVSGEKGLDVGDRVRVRLVDTDVERGFIDFAALRRK